MIILRKSLPPILMLVTIFLFISCNSKQQNSDNNSKSGNNSFDITQNSESIPETDSSKVEYSPKNLSDYSKDSVIRKDSVIKEEFKYFDISIIDTVRIDTTNFQTLIDTFYYKNRIDSTLFIIKEGTYFIENNLYLNGHNVIIEGQGKVKINCKYFYSDVLFINGNNIHIKNLHLTHLDKYMPEFRYCTGRVVSLGIVENLIIEDCDINGCGKAGIIIKPHLSKNILIKNNHIHNNSVAAIMDWDGNVWQEEIHDHPFLSFENNLIENNGFADSLDRAIEESRKAILKDLQIEFPKYNIIIDNFICGEIEKKYVGDDDYSFSGSHTNTRFHYGTEGYVFTLEAIADTIYFSEYLDRYISNHKIRIVPEDTSDRFEVYYAFIHSIDEASDWRKKKSPKVMETYQWMNFRDTTNFTQIPDSANYNFRLPDFWNNIESDKLIEKMKGKYMLRDTSYYIPGEYSTDISFMKDKRPFTHWVGSMIIKIELIRNSDITDIKYIEVYQNEIWD